MLTLARRLLPIAAQDPSSDQYAYQQARSADTLPVDLNLSVEANGQEEKAIYVAGLDILRAYDSASH